MRVTRGTGGNAPAHPVEHDILTLYRPLTGEGPVVDLKVLGELVGAVFVERGAVG